MNLSHNCALLVAGFYNELAARKDIARSVEIFGGGPGPRYGVRLRIQWVQDGRLCGNCYVIQGEEIEAYPDPTAIGWSEARNMLAGKPYQPQKA